MAPADPPQKTTTTILRLLVRILAAGLLVPVIGLIILALTTPLTLSGVLYLAGAVAIVIGLWAIGWGYVRLRLLLLAGLGLVVALAALRLFLLNSDGSGARIRQIHLPEQSAQCWINCLLDEQDVALFSTHLLSFTGWISPTEQTGLMDAMYSGYRALAQTQPLTPSPFVRTYLNQQRPGDFDTVIVEPDGGQPAQEGVIFLHGFAGNFTMPCWLFAQMFRERRVVTVCPSVGWQGAWWTDGGEATLRATLAYLHGRGVTRIYLAGLSNGAVGISALAYKLSDQSVQSDQIAGLILVSGASLDARDSGLPVLVIIGQNDERMPADSMKAYADRMGAHATFVELPSDHFMLAKDTEDIRSAIAAWLRQNG